MHCDDVLGTMAMVTMEGQWDYRGEGGKHAVYSCSEYQGKLLRVEKQVLSSDALSPSPECEHRDVSFIRGTVKPFLGCFVDVPLSACLDSEVAKDLRRRAMESGRVPASRVASWDTHSKRRDPLALLVEDYSSPMSIELKPKAGYCAFSPLVDPRRRFKYQSSRYTWMRPDARYNPLDLFSNDLKRVEHALESLVEEPRNNLFGECHVPVVATILYGEPLLARLLEMQRLDWVDADGAVLIYDRLVATYGRDHVERLIDGDFVVSGHSAGTESFRRLVDDSAPLLEQGCLDLDDARAIALQIVNELTKDEMVYLLQMWLLSLAACDMSIILSLEGVTPAERSLSATVVAGLQWMVEAHQSETDWGVVVGMDGATVSHRWRYRLKVIDCGRKPASKLATRGSKEAKYD